LPKRVTASGNFFVISGSVKKDELFSQSYEQHLRTLLEIKAFSAGSQVNVVLPPSVDEEFSPAIVRTIAHLDESDLRAIIYDSSASHAGVDISGAPAYSFAHGTLMKTAGRLGLLIVFASIALLLVSVPAGLVGMYAGFALFALANYTAYRVGQDDTLIGPSSSALLTFASAALALVALTRVIFS
jgi:hypothetical protein